jgi:hypothetical protein
MVGIRNPPSLLGNQKSRLATQRLHSTRSPEPLTSWLHPNRRETCASQQTPSEHFITCPRHCQSIVFTAANYGHICPPTTATMPSRNPWRVSHDAHRHCRRTSRMLPALARARSYYIVRKSSDGGPVAAYVQHRSTVSRFHGATHPIVRVFGSNRGT